MRGQRDPLVVLEASAKVVLEASAKELGVFVRPAKLSDASQLIELNKHFRYEMAQWEAGLSSSGECKGYPVLDFDDVQYILEEEDPKNLMVMGRRLEGEERFVGYSYSYAEPWEATTDGPVAHPMGIMSPRPNRVKGSRKGSSKDPESEKQSIYIAELFISDSERGLGLGELLLTQTLKVHMRESTRSHLFVSSQNVGAVKCYLKFGYQKGSKPSGDLAHDLVMELPSSQISVVSAVGRFDKQLAEGTLGARKRRPPHAAGSSDSRSSMRACASSPPKLSGAKATSGHNGSPEQADSRASSRSTARGSPQNASVTLCPRPTRGRPASSDDDVETSRRITRTGKASQPSQAHSPVTHQTSASDRGSKRSPLMSGSGDEDYDGFHSPLNIIRGRQRKALKLDGVCAAGRSLRSGETSEPSESKGRKAPSKQVANENDQARNGATRSEGRNKFMITLFSDGKRRIAEDRIKALGGEIVTSDHYDPMCTHVVSARPATTEKFLCATAAGKYVMHPSYIEDSFKHGAFLPERDYEWCNAIDAMDGHVEEQGKALAKAPELWKAGKKAPKSRKSVACADAIVQKSCFEGVVCVLLSTEDKREGFRRILEAGGAVVCADPADPPRSSKKGAALSDWLLPEDLRERNKTVTHVFVNKDIYEMKDEGWQEDHLQDVLPILEELYENGARFLFEDFIVEKIAHNVDLRCKAGKAFVVDVDSWMEANQAPLPAVGSKRKAIGKCDSRERPRPSSMLGSFMPSNWR